jgi:enolase
MTNEKDKLKQNLEKVAEERGDQQAVSYQDLFSPMFMQKNTSFATIDVFIRELGLKDFQEIEKIDDKVIDDFVKKETKFNNWQEMQQRAVSEYMTSLF